MTVHCVCQESSLVFVGELSLQQSQTLCWHFNPTSHNFLLTQLIPVLTLLRPTIGSVNKTGIFFSWNAFPLWEYSFSFSFYYVSENLITAAPLLCFYFGLEQEVVQSCVCALEVFMVINAYLAHALQCRWYITCFWKNKVRGRAPVALLKGQFTQIKNISVPRLRC